LGRQPTLDYARNDKLTMVASLIARTPRPKCKEQSMKPILAAVAVCGLLASPALANPTIDAAIKTFEAVAADPGKLKTYCEMSKLSAGGGDDADDSKSEALDKQMQEYMKQLGQDFETAYEAGADLDPESADGKAYDAALDKLDDKCGK
jgi:hypothetical protein